MKQLIIPFLPGYMWDGRSLKSTGVAITPTQHINKSNGEIIYYCKPLWDYPGQKVGLFIRHKGLEDWVRGIKQDQ